MRPMVKRVMILFLAIIIAFTAQISLISPALAAQPIEKEYNRLNRKIEMLEKGIPDGYYYPWSEFSLNRRIRICRISLMIIYYKEIRLRFEEVNDIYPRTATWSFIVNARANYLRLLEELLAQRRGLYSRIWWTIRYNIGSITPPQGCQ